MAMRDLLTVQGSYSLLHNRYPEYNIKKYFSSFDMISKYHQIPVAFEDQERTVFMTPYALFKIQKIPSRLTHAPETFQRGVCDLN